MHPEPGETGLTLARADQDVALYRCFLKLCVLHPGATIVPTRQLDHVWHTHMLDTAKYRADCDWVFGFFLDHFPYFGFRGEADRRAWREDFARTRRLFSEHFNVDIGGQPAASACRNHGDGSGCCVGCIKPPAADARPRRTAACSPPGVACAAEPVVSCGGDHLHAMPISPERATAAQQSAIVMPHHARHLQATS